VTRPEGPARSIYLRWTNTDEQALDPLTSSPDHLGANRETV